MKRVLLFGSGGHAKVVMEAIRALYADIEISVLDDRESRWGSALLGAPIVADVHLRWPTATRPSSRPWVTTRRASR